MWAGSNKQEKSSSSKAYYYCKICSKVFQLRYQLSNHKKRRHPDGDHENNNNSKREPPRNEQHSAYEDPEDIVVVSESNRKNSCSTTTTESSSFQEQFDDDGADSNSSFSGLLISKVESCSSMAASSDTNFDDDVPIDIHMEVLPDTNNDVVIPPPPSVLNFPPPPEWIFCQHCNENFVNLEAFTLHLPILDDDDHLSPHSKIQVENNQSSTVVVKNSEPVQSQGLTLINGLSEERIKQEKSNETVRIKQESEETHILGQKRNTRSSTTFKTIPNFNNTNNNNNYNGGGSSSSSSKNSTSLLNSSSNSNLTSNEDGIGNCLPSNETESILPLIPINDVDYDDVHYHQNLSSSLSTKSVSVRSSRSSNHSMSPPRKRQSSRITPPKSDSDSFDGTLRKRSKKMEETSISSSVMGNSNPIKYDRKTTNISTSFSSYLGSSSKVSGPTTTTAASLSAPPPPRAASLPKRLSPSATATTSTTSTKTVAARQPGKKSPYSGPVFFYLQGNFIESRKLMVYSLKDYKYKQVVSISPVTGEVVNSTLKYSNNSIYILGGQSGGTLGKAFSKLHIFDLTTKKWRTGHVPAMNEERCEFDAVVTDDYIYAVGGDQRKGGGSWLNMNCVERLSLHPDAGLKDKWKWENVEFMKFSRQNCGVAHLKGKIYVVGGYAGNKDKSEAQATNSVESLQVESNKATGWKQEPSLRTKRIGACAVATDSGLLYALGGGSEFTEDTSQMLKTVEVFNPARKDLGWIYGPSMLKGRQFFSAFFHDDSIYAVGGDKNREHPTLERLDLKTLTWELIKQAKLDAEGHYWSIAFKGVM